MYNRMSLADSVWANQVIRLFVQFYRGADATSEQELEATAAQFAACVSSTVSSPPPFLLQPPSSAASHRWPTSLCISLILLCGMLSCHRLALPVNSLGKFHHRLDAQYKSSAYVAASPGRNHSSSRPIIGWRGWRTWRSAWQRSKGTCWYTRRRPPRSPM